MSTQPPVPAKESSRISVLLAADSASTTSWLRSVLSEHEEVEVIGEAQDGLEAAQMCREWEPLVCVIDVDLPGMDGFQTCELIGLAAPVVACVLVMDGAAASYETVMRVGARGFVAPGTDGQELLDIISDIAAIAQRRHSREYAQVTDPDLMPITITVGAAKGGVGKTTVAVNLAVTLAEKYPDEVILVDCYAHYGDDALALGLPHRRTILDLAQDGVIDEEGLESYFVRHRSSLRLLPGATEPTSTAAQLTPEFMARLLSTLRRRFRITVVDIPPVLDEVTAHVISRSHQFAVICNLSELTTLRDTILLLHAVSGRWTSPERIRVVANRTAAKTKYALEDSQEALGHAIAHQIPEATELAVNALNSGVPFVLSDPDAPVSQSIAALAEMVTSRNGLPKQAELPTPAPTESIWNKLVTGVLRGERQ